MTLSFCSSLREPFRGGAYLYLYFQLFSFYPLWNLLLSGSLPPYFSKSALVMVTNDSKTVNFKGKPRPLFYFDQQENLPPFIIYSILKHFFLSCKQGINSIYWNIRTQYILHKALAKSTQCSLVKIQMINFEMHSNSSNVWTEGFAFHRFSTAVNI